MKAVIPAAGLGTRFLPYAKSQPKEMIPVVDKPTIQYVVEEAVYSGLHDILIITGRGKRAIEDHFDKNIELESHLRQKGETEALRELEGVWKSARIHYVRQGEPLGLGHAVLASESHVGNEPFACLLGDDVMVAPTPCTRELVEIHERHGCVVVAVQRVPRDRVGRYGMVVATKLENRLYRLHDIVEKPSREEAVSDLVVIGRYVLTPDVFGLLRGLGPSRNGEIQLTDALRVMARKGDVLGFEFGGKRYDIGNKVDWILANVEFALARDDLKSELRTALAGLMQEPRP